MSLVALDRSPAKFLATPLDTTPVETLPARRVKKAEGHQESDRAAWAPTSRRSRVTGHTILILLTLFTVFPIGWMYLESFRPPTDLFSSGLIATSVSGANYSAAVHAIPVGILIEHTLIIAICVTLGQLITGILAAYSFARFRFRGRNILFFLFIGSWLVPFQITMLPNYVLESHLGLLNSLQGIIIPEISSAVSALAIVMLRQHLNSFPTELLEAAKVEGQSNWSTLWTVVVPNLTPAISALSILLFVTAWNEYFWPLLVYRNPNSVIQLGIAGFLNSVSINYGALMAMSGLATLPIFAIYAVLQRRVVNAFVRSGLR